MNKIKTAADLVRERIEQLAAEKARKVVNAAAHAAKVAQQRLSQIQREQEGRARREAVEAEVRAIALLAYPPGEKPPKCAPTIRDDLKREGSSIAQT